MGIRDSLTLPLILSICFSTERLILSASKYSRYIFWGGNVEISIETRQEKGQVECLRNNSWAKYLKLEPFHALVQIENCSFHPSKMYLEHLDADKMRRSVEKPI